MTLYDVYKGINYLVNKDVSGLSFTPDQFNLVCRIVQQSMFTESLEAFKRPSDQPKTDEDVSLFSPLENLIKSALLIPPYILPSDFFYQLAVSVSGLECEILDSKRWSDSVQNPFYESSRPPVKFENGAIILTTAPAIIELVYYRKPIDPLFDWVYDTYSNVIYMEPGSFLNKVGSSYNLVRAINAYADNTSYSVGDRVVYLNIAYEANNFIPNTNAIPPSINPSFTNLGNPIIASNVSHVLPDSYDNYVSQSVELDIPQHFYERFIQLAYKYVLSNLYKNQQ